jgi:hypothetical protein
LIDSTCFFSGNLCWFITETQEGAKTFNRCSVITAQGDVIATAEAEKDDGSWLGQIRGKAATANFLFAITGEGIVRVALSGGRIEQDLKFEDTADHVHSGCHLFLGDGGIYVVDGKSVTLLQI